jgi:ABC-type nitrate/sulfonate/bicarbonate transport system permease component
MNTALSRREFWVLSIAGTLGFFGLWTLIALSGLVQQQFLPTPRAVLEKFVDLTRNPFVGYTLQQHLLSSFGRFGAGLRACRARRRAAWPHDGLVSLAR